MAQLIDATLDTWAADWDGDSPPPVGLRKELKVVGDIDICDP